MRPSVTLSALFEGLTPQALTVTPWGGCAVSELTLDPYEVCESTPTLLVARTMWYRDTHEELTLALERGARALLVSYAPSAEVLALAESRKAPVLLIPDEDPTLGVISSRFYGHPTRSLKVYGVTGTNGKTSTVSYLSELLEASGERVAVMGTVEYRFERQRLSAPNTTPDALVIHRFARDALDLGATALALEVSSHALTLGRVACVSFDAVGFTNLSRDHLDFHGDMEGYRDAKGALFGQWMLESLAVGKRPSAVAYEGPEGEGMLARCPEGVRLTRAWAGPQTGEQAEPNGTQERCVVELVERPSVTEMRLRATLPDGLRLPALAFPLIGDYHPSNLAVALGMLWGTHDAEREALERAWQSLAHTQGVKGRMELAWSEGEGEAQGRGRVALVDYAHTPEAVTRALEALRSVHQGPIWVALGCGGDRDRGKRPLMARAALELSDRLYLTSDNPRSEDPLQILDDAQQGLSAEERARVSVVVDRRRAISEAWRALPARGALLIAGKGHESYQELVLGGVKRRFALSDSELVRASSLTEREGFTGLDELPYLKSVQTQSASPAVELIYEASLRERGLSLTLWVEERQGMDEADPPSPEALSIIVTSIDDALADVERELRPRHRRVELRCVSEALFEALYQHLDEELSALICAHRGARALSADRAEGSLLQRAGRRGHLKRAGWVVGGASAAYIPSLARD